MHAVRGELMPKQGGAGAVTSVMGLAAVPLLLHLLTNSRYGYFRDEFYYMACSQHLDWGYVDHPPLSIALLALERGLFGDSLLAIRFLPALAGAALIVLTAVLVRELGGGRFAQFLAALSVVIAPMYLAVDNFYSMNAFEPLLWMLALWIVLRIANTGNARLWILFGLVAGLGMENKHSMLFLGFGVVIALVLTPQRKYLRDKWLWFGGTLAVLLMLPNVLWEVIHGWPTLEFMRNAQAQKIAALSPAEFIAQQLLMLHPLAAPLWITGLCYYLFTAAGRRYRFCGWIYLAVLAVLLIQRAKPYYLTPIYPVLFAAGAVVFERWTARAPRRWLRPAYVAILVLGGMVTAPVVLPILPVETLVRYTRALHLDAGVKGATAEKAALDELPQYFADMFGWEEMVATVAQAYEALPTEERAKAAIYASNYGEAGAIAFLGKARHLPEPISGHNNYWLWGPGDYSGEVVIVLGSSQEELQAQFETVQPAGTVQCRFCMPFENHRTVYICRGLKWPLRQVWPQLKRYV